MEGQMVKLSEVKKGDFVRMKEGATKTYIKGEYVREEKKYSLLDYEAVGDERLVKGSTMVHIGFTY